MNAKFHSSQKKTDPFTAMNASKITNHKVAAALDLADVLVLVDEMAALDLADAQEKCLLQPAGIVETNAKSHSNQKKTDLSIATSVFKIINKIKKF